VNSYRKPLQICFIKQIFYRKHCTIIIPWTTNPSLWLAKAAAEAEVLENGVSSGGLNKSSQESWFAIF